MITTYTHVRVLSQNSEIIIPKTEIAATMKAKLGIFLGDINTTTSKVSCHLIKW
jgi:hypothetical protein